MIAITQNKIEKTSAYAHLILTDTVNTITMHADTRHILSYLNKETYSK